MSRYFRITYSGKWSNSYSNRNSRSRILVFYQSTAYHISFRIVRAVFFFFCITTNLRLGGWSRDELAPVPLVTSPRRGIRHTGGPDRPVQRLPNAPSTDDFTQFAADLSCDNRTGAVASARDARVSERYIIIIIIIPRTSAYKNK